MACEPRKMRGKSNYKRLCGPVSQDELLFLICVTVRVLPNLDKALVI
jgi:hypothetical protein